MGGQSTTSIKKRQNANIEHKYVTYIYIYIYIYRKIHESSNMATFTPYNNGNHPLMEMSSSNLHVER